MQKIENPSALHKENSVESFCFKQFWADENAEIQKIICQARNITTIFLRNHLLNQVIRTKQNRTRQNKKYIDRTHTMINKDSNRLQTTLCGITLDNPVIAASGTFGYGYEFAEIYDINELGTFSFKGTTKEPRFGNPTPRIAEIPCGMLNSVGLQNPGIDKVITEELPKLRACFHKPVMANVSGFSTEEYAYVCERLDAEEQIGWLEVNISCPNVHGGGMGFGTDPQMAAEVTHAVRAVTKKPIIMKLTPNVTDIVSIAKACEEAGADGISLINTMLAMRIDLRTQRPVLANVTGGMSGPAVFPVAVRMVYQVAKAVGIPVVGLGGVSSPEDVLEMLMAGACAVEVGAANLTDPYACKRIIDGLPAAMDRYGIEKLSDIIGAAHRA